MAKPSRKPRGGYDLTPEDRPLFSEIYKQPYWEVNGITNAGKRIHGKRFHTYVAARLYRNSLEEADKKQGTSPEVIVVEALNELEGRDAVRAIARFPRADNGKANPIYKLEDAVIFALDMGFNPTWLNWMIKPLIEKPRGFLADVDRRERLPKTDESNLSKDGAKNLRYATRVLLRVYGSLTFSLDDIVDLPSLAKMLKQPQRPIDLWLAGRLSAEARATLADYQDSSPDQAPLQIALWKDLNEAIRSLSMYNEQRFSGIALRDGTRDLLSKEPKGDDLLLLSRLLLEDAYPAELARKEIYGDIKLLKLMNPDYQRRVITKTIPTIEMARKVCSATSAFLGWLRHNHQVISSRVYMPGKPQKGMPQIMSLLMQQAYLDRGWDTEWACRVVKLLFLALRPTEASAPEGYLSEDCRSYHVPDDTKTGWRDVEVPPIAQILFGILKVEGRLEDKAPTSDSALTRFLAEVGFYCSRRTIARRYLGGDLTDETPEGVIADCVKKFRVQFPQRKPSLQGCFGR